MVIDGKIKFRFLTYPYQKVMNARLANDQIFITAVPCACVRDLNIRRLRILSDETIFFRCAQSDSGVRDARSCLLHIINRLSTISLGNWITKDSAGYLPMRGWASCRGPKQCDVNFARPSSPFRKQIKNTPNRE